MILARMLSRTRVVSTILVLIGVVACAWLGRWQLDRLAQRRAFNQHMAAVRALTPLELPTAENLRGQEYRAVLVRGKYDTAHEIAIRNQAYDGEYGYHLVTPLVLKTASATNPASAVAVLVDRGWIPADDEAQRGDWRKYDVRGAVVVHGVIRLSQTVPVEGAGAAPAPNETPTAFWIYVDIDRIARQLPYPVLPVYVQLEPGPETPDLPAPSQPNLDLSEGPHQGYAIQWFGFATLLIVGYPLYVWKQEERKA